MTQQKDQLLAVIRFKIQEAFHYFIPFVIGYWEDTH